MSLLPRRAASLPGPSGSLCALLALLQLLTLPGPLASGECSQPGTRRAEQGAQPLQLKLQQAGRREVFQVKLAGVVFPATFLITVSLFHPQLVPPGS